MSLWRELSSEIRGLWLEFRRLVHRFYAELWLVFGILLMLAVCLWPMDAVWVRLITGERPSHVLEFAYAVRRWGAFTDTLTFAVALFLCGWIFRRPYWRRVALASLLAGAVAGSAVNVLRISTGRPRPRAHEPDRFTGPTLVYKRQSFPSGHSGASFGSATTIATALPAAGIPALISATAIAWSSIYSQNHYPTDVLVGSGMGITTGLLFGFASRSGRKRNPSLGPFQRSAQ